MKFSHIYQSIITLLFIALFVPTATFAHADDTTGESSDTRSAWEHVVEMQQVIHEAKFTTENIQYGITTTVTSADKDVVAAIQQELLAHEDELQSAFEEYIVTGEEIGSGASFTFQADSRDNVEYLQENGNFVLVSFLMNEMMNLMREEGSGFDMMNGYGMMGVRNTVWEGGGSMMGFGTILGGGMWLGWIVLIAVIGLIIYFVAKLANGSTSGTSAKDILDQRFAKGEISEKEYEEKKKAMQ